MSEYIPLFTKDFLSSYLSNFELSNVIGISQSRKIIEDWATAERSGKIRLMKEESIKSRFLMEIFGQLLGFSYKNSGKWLFQEELKSKVGQTKPDAALGTFYISQNKIHSEVRIVIEVKNATSNLDEKQNRPCKITPVDQAFLYSTKMHGKCRWVIVTNLREIRIYRANDQSKYQRYFITELLDEHILKEFVFLFHRDRFDNNDDSTTNKLFLLHLKTVPKEKSKKHIIDELYVSLKRFEKMYFIDPKLIANLKPFNILDNHVWHYSPSGKLFTLNHNIYELIRSLNYQEGELHVDHDYELLLKKARIIEYRKKLEYIFEKLHKAQIYSISALKSLETTKEQKKHTIGFTYRHPVQINEENGASMKIKLKANASCDCVACNYRSLDFRRLISKIDRMESEAVQESLELAYAHYLIATDNHKKSYRLLKNIEAANKGSDENILLYFSAKFNLLYHHNLFYDEGEGKKIRQELYAIDLERVINNEIDIYVDNEVRRLLLEIKDNKLFNSAWESCRETVQNIKEMKLLYDRGGEMSGPNYPALLHDEYLKVYGHFQQNYLVHDIFKDHREFVELVLEGLLLSIQTLKAGLPSMNEFYLTEAVLYASSSRLKELLSEIDEIPMEDGEKKQFLSKAEAFFSSYTHVGLFGHFSKNEVIAKQLLNHSFNEKFNRIFNNLCTILTHIQISKEDFAPLAEPIVRFITVDDDLNWWDVEQLGKLILGKDLFSNTQLFEMLKSAIGPHRYPKGNKYRELITTLCATLKKYHPSFLITDEHLTRLAILSCYNEGRADLLPLAGIWKISNVENQRLISEEFEKELDKNFNEHLYEYLLKRKIIPYDRKDYLMKLANEVNKIKVIGFTGIENGIVKYNHTAHLNFLMIPYILGLEFRRPEFMLLETLSHFDSWLLDPITFDYKDFDPYWLLACNSHILKRLSGDPRISNALENILKLQFDKKLAEIYFSYFLINPDSQNT